FKVIAIVFAIAVIGALIWLLRKLFRDILIPEKDPEFSPATRPHFVRLFDDTSLFKDPAIKSDASLAQRFFPAARRALLKLWWTGAGDLYIRSRRLKLEVSFTGQDAPVQTVPAPIAPMTAVEYAHYLTAAVKDASGTAGKLKAAMVHATDLDYELPPGASFAGEGDGE